MREFLTFSRAIFLSFCILLTFGSQSLNAAPIIPGLHRNHPLTEVQKGHVLIEELRCASCHEGVSQYPSLSAPNLQDVGSRVKADFLKKYIQSPASHDPGTTMPDLISNRSPEEQEELAASLSAYLISLKSKPADTSSLPEVSKKEDGKKLFNEAGCIACHSPKDDHGLDITTDGNVGLNHVSAKYHPAGLAEFLQQPLKVRPDGRMPDMKLSKSEAELLAAFLTGIKSTKTAPEKTESSTEQIASGKKAFTALRCIACHEVGDEKPTALPSVSVTAAHRAELNLNAGCLSETPGKAPNYHLNESQRSAIRSALIAPPEKPIPAEEIKIRLTQLNCISCHERDDYGGVSPELDGYFHSTQEALGNESRIPPTLTLTGAKLRAEWMNKVFYEGESVRPYMTTRMPQYGTVAMAGLTKLFGKIDKLDPFKFAEFDEESTPMMRDGAHLLLGDTGLNCIACHNYNGKESPSMKGLDLMTSYQRLQPAWFNQFMRNPGTLRPGIIMPSFWPDGKAVQTEILEGKAEDQIRSLWFNFSLGRSARDPSGLNVEDPELTVTDKTITYRGRSNVAGYRGIAVGFPGGLNYAFNAQNGALSAIWKGKFVKVGWTGQGSGNFTPSDRAIQLAQDIAFLPTEADPWPLNPQRSKEIPVNPDPLYPRQYGYAFKGYSIGENGVPTFRYKIGAVLIEDTSIALSENSKLTLRRTLTFHSPKTTPIFFRALTGKVNKISDNKFENSDVQLTVGTASAFSSTALRESENGELILGFDLPSGISTQTIDYAPLR